jgi:translocation and assembly module TamB
MDVDMPGSLYVRSKTLDSVWGGHVQVVLTNGEWGLAGYLEPRRGTVLLLKRQFKITQGRVEFDGSWPPVPSLRIEADFSSRDLLAHLLLVGSIRNPSITLTSEPALPEDEILSRVLFGKDTSKITPLQALDLASEAARLRNTGAGTGLLDDLQNAVGIDRVEVRNADSEKGGTEIAAGKYVGDRTYVEMRHTATTDAGGMGFYLEREIGPNLILEAETDSSIEMRSGIGVSWKMDY